MGDVAWDATIEAYVVSGYDDIVATFQGVSDAADELLGVHQRMTLPELEQATITQSLERVVGLIESGTGLVPTSDLQSPMLDVPVAGVAPESGLVV